MEIVESAALPRNKLDGRTRAARVMRDTKAALLASLGHTPTRAEIFIVKRVAMHELKLRMLETKPEPTAADNAAYVGLSRVQSDLLGQLGLTRPKI